MLRIQIVVVFGVFGRGNSNVLIVEVVMCMIIKMISMVEKCSGDVDVLEN